MRYRMAAILGAFLIFSQSSGQVVPTLNAESLVGLTHNLNDTTYVVNFWATWCSPCVKEIGYFEELYRQMHSTRVKVVLVSLDFPNQLDQRVIPFLKEKNISAPVYLMTDLDYNSWIDRVDPSWSGAIPATLIYNRDKRVFLEQELTRDELFKQVSQIKL